LKIGSVEENTSLEAQQNIDLRRYVEELEQYNRRNNLEITGIQAADEEDELGIVLKIVAVLEVDIKREDIVACHPLKKRGSLNAQKL